MRTATYTGFLTDPRSEESQETSRVANPDLVEFTFELAHDEWLNVQHNTGFCDGGVCTLAPLYQKWFNEHASPRGNELERAAFYEWVAIVEGGGAREDGLVDAIIATIATAGVGGIYSLLRGAGATIFASGAARSSPSLADEAAGLLGNADDVVVLGRHPACQGELSPVVHSKSA